MIPLKTLGRWLRPGLLFALSVFFTGCSSAILAPKGQIGHDQKTLLITATVLMLLVVVPVIIMTLAFAWKYRATRTPRPVTSRSGRTPPRSKWLSGRSRA
jgi:cytochrome o ubiquinol oxidase subunit 2